MRMAGGAAAVVLSVRAMHGTQNPLCAGAVRVVAVGYVVAPLFVAAAALLALGCNRGDQPRDAESRVSQQVASPPPEAEPSRAAGLEAPAVQPDSAAVQAAASPARVSDANFELAMEASGRYRVGQQAEVKILLEAKGAYKVNNEYPYRFKLQPTEGVKYESMLVRRDAVVLTKQRATMTIRLVPEAAGNRTVVGRFFFSICTDEKCLIDKRDLALSIQVH
jgi:hypothetical protein